jgi:hypothetical protein
MIDDDTLKLLEFSSYLVTVFGLPLAVFALWRDARAERDNERKEFEQRDEETYLRLSEQYTEFLDAVLQYPELGLHPRLPAPSGLDAEQQARKLLLFDMLIALFERAFILLYEDTLDAQGARRWQSWADYIEQWCGREDFRDALDALLFGEDPEFARYILAIRDRARAAIPTATGATTAASVPTATTAPAAGPAAVAAGRGPAPTGRAGAPRSAP